MEPATHKFFLLVAIITFKDYVIRCVRYVRKHNLLKRARRVILCRLSHYRDAVLYRFSPYRGLQDLLIWFIKVVPVKSQSPRLDRFISAPGSAVFLQNSSFAKPLSLNCYSENQKDRVKSDPPKTRPSDDSARLREETEAFIR